jgi:flagellar export protein FliJ
MSMGKSRPQGLQCLLELRQREVDRLSAQMADKHATQARFRSNLQRLEHLCTGASASSDLAHLSGNCADYKLAVLQLAAAHRNDLALHEADMAVTRGVLAAAARRQQALAQMVARQAYAQRHAQETREQKRQDELASQMWIRGQA